MMQKVNKPSNILLLGLFFFESVTCSRMKSNSIMSQVDGSNDLIFYPAFRFYSHQYIV